MKNVNFVSLIAIGGAGANTVSRISGCNRIVVESSNAQIQSAYMIPTILLDVPSIQSCGYLPVVDVENIKAEIDDSDVVVLCAGLGGNTGSAIAPMIARLAKDQGKIVVAVLFKPFAFEGSIRSRNAENSFNLMRDWADSIIYVSNDKLIRLAPARAKMADAFSYADKIVSETIEIVYSALQKGVVGNVAKMQIANAIKCPVCSSMVDSNEKRCRVCGFDQLGFEALNKEDAEEWLNNVVIPARDKWVSQQSAVNLIVDELSMHFSANEIVIDVSNR